MSFIILPSTYDMSSQHSNNGPPCCKDLKDLQLCSLFFDFMLMCVEKRSNDTRKMKAT